MKTTFKNLSTGLMAAAFGLTLVFAGSAFKADNKGTQYTFRYNNSNHDKAHVETPGNWVYDASAPECDEQQQQACIIKVDANYVNAGTTPTLKSTLNLVAVPYSTADAFVASSADETMTIENRSIEQ